MAFVDRFQEAPTRYVPMGGFSAVDNRILDVLTHYRLLDAPYIAALAQTHWRHTHKRLKLLRAPDNRYVQIVEVQRRNRESYRNQSLYFELGPNAPRAAEFSGPVQRLDHKAGEQHILAEFELGVRAHPDHLELVSRAEVLRDAPLQTQNAISPESIPLTSRTENGHARHLRLDGRMFVLVQKKQDRGLFFPGIEYETGSNRIRASKTNAAQSSVQQKYRDNIDILKNRIYKSHFNRNSCYFAYFCTSHVDMNDMYDVWYRESADYPQFRKNILFKPNYTPRPTSQMIEEPFFYLTEKGHMAEFSLLGD